MATEWISPTWRMPVNSNQSKVENYSLDFDPAGDWLELESAADPLPVFTPQDKKFSVSTWVKPDDATPAAMESLFYIMSYGGAGKIGLYIATTGNVHFRVYSGGAPQKEIISTATLSDNTWYHIVGTWDGSTINLYIDGASAATPVAATSAYTATTGNTWATFGCYRFGSTGASRGGYFTGEAGQLAIWNNITLSAPQITALYNLGTPVNPMALTPLPIAYYPLGGSSTGSASTLTVPNNSVPSTTVFDFDGSDYINCGNSTALQITGALTLSAWIKSPAGTGTNQGIIYKDDNTNRCYKMQLAGLSGVPLGRLQFSTFDSGVVDHTDGTTSLTDDDWHHVVAVYTPSTSVVLYVDGVVQTTNTTLIPASIDNDPADFEIGRKGDGTLYFDGEIFNVQVWNTNLDLPEVETVYNNGVPLLTMPSGTLTDDLKSWWKLNVDTSTWNGSDWLFDNDGIIPTYTSAIALPNTYQNPPGAYTGVTRSTTTWSSDNITLSFWVKFPYGWQSGQHFIRTNTLNQQTFQETKIQLGVNAHYRNYTNASGSINAFDGAWHHYVIYIPNTNPTFNPSNIRVWEDSIELSGASVGSTTANQITSISGWGITSGSHNELSNWALFDTDLSSAGNITTLYNNGTPGDISSLNPVTWYKCDTNNVDFPDPATTEITFTDSSVNSNTGTCAYDSDATPPDPHRPYIATTNVRAGSGISDGMTTANLVASDLTRSIPYSSYSMDFDGTADYIDLGTDSSLDIFGGNFSVSLWFNTTVSALTNGLMDIAYFTDKFAITTGSNLNTGMGFAVTGVWYYNIGSGLTDGNWHHMVVTNTGGTYKAYIDGVDTAYSTGTLSQLEPRNVIATAREPYLAYEFPGNLSNVAIWNSTLTIDQILTIYNGGVPNDISSLSPVSWWSLAGDSYYNGSDWICPDLGSGGNNGTSSNMGGTELVGDGPGSTVNSIATSMGIPANLKGDASNSSNNAFSVNMPPQSRVAF